MDTTFTTCMPGDRVELHGAPLCGKTGVVQRVTWSSVHVLVDGRLHRVHQGEITLIAEEA